MPSDGTRFASQRPRAEVGLRLAGTASIALGVMRLAQTPSIRQRAAVVLGEVFPSPSAMRYRHGFAGPGRAALTLGYLSRPLWPAFKLPGAYRAVKRSRIVHQFAQPKSAPPWVGSEVGLGAGRA